MLKRRPKRHHPLTCDVPYVYVKTAYTVYEKGLLRALFEDHGIPYSTITRGLGSAMTVIAGTSLLADDFYVPETDRSRALDLLEGFVLTGSPVAEATVIDDEPNT